MKPHIDNEQRTSNLSKEPCGVSKESSNSSKRAVYSVKWDRSDCVSVKIMRNALIASPYIYLCTHVYMYIYTYIYVYMAPALELQAPVHPAKRDLYPTRSDRNWQKRLLSYQKRALSYQERPLTYQKRPLSYQKRPSSYQKRPSSYLKRPLSPKKDFDGQKRFLVSKKSCPLPKRPVCY